MPEVKHKKSELLGLINTKEEDESAHISGIDVRNKSRTQTVESSADPDKIGKKAPNNLFAEAEGPDSGTQKKKGVVNILMMQTNAA